MQISEHFSLEEFTASTTAKNLGIDNSVPPYLMPNLTKTAYGLEEVRTLLGDKPIHVSSGYRSPALNKAVRGTQLSQHVTANAVDFICPLFGTPEQIVRKIVESEINFDQVIAESANGAKWCHISFSDRNRKQALIIDQQGTRSFA